MAMNLIGAGRTRRRRFPFWILTPMMRRVSNHLMLKNPLYRFRPSRPVNELSIAEQALLLQRMRENQAIRPWDLMKMRFWKLLLDKNPLAGSAISKAVAVERTKLQVLMDLSLMPLIIFGRAGLKIGKLAKYLTIKIPSVGLSAAKNFLVETLPNLADALVSKAATMVRKGFKKAGQLISPLVNRVVNGALRVYAPVRKLAAAVETRIQNGLERVKKVAKQIENRWENMKAFVNQTVDPIIRRAEDQTARMNRFVEEQVAQIRAFFERNTETYVKKPFQVVVQNTTAAVTAVAVPMVALFHPLMLMVKNSFQATVKRGKKNQSKFKKFMQKCASPMRKFYVKANRFVVAEVKYFASLFVMLMGWIAGLMNKLAQKLLQLSFKLGRFALFVGYWGFIGVKNSPGILYRTIVGLPQAFYQLARYAFQK